MAVVKKARAGAVRRTSELVRPWRGVGPEQRVADRRERLLAAGLEVFATRTFPGTKVRDLCREAALTERYFYESFVDKEALLTALSERIVTDFVAAVEPSLAMIEADADAAIRGAMTALVSSLTDDPRRARILFIEVVGVSPAVEDRRRAVIASLVEVVRGAIVRAFGSWVRESVEVELMVRALIGAAAELLVAYVRDELPIKSDELARNLSRLFLRARPVLVAMAAEQTPDHDIDPAAAPR